MKGVAIKAAYRSKGGEKPVSSVPFPAQLALNGMLQARIRVLSANKMLFAHNDGRSRLRAPPPDIMSYNVNVREASGGGLPVLSIQTLPKQ